MDFIKMQTLGNDYILIDCLEFNKNDFSRLKDKVKDFSDRHFGIGANGVVFIMDSKVADVKLIMFNQDGSESKTCTDAIRCVTKYLSIMHLINKDEIKIETKSGIKCTTVNNNTNQIIINMGNPNLSARKIPVITDKSIFINDDITVLNQNFKTTCVSMGNPHAVSFIDFLDKIDFQKIGPYFEMHYRFPERVNVEIAKVVNPNTVNVKIWSRGVGEVLSCGSGACASVVAGVLNHYFNKNEWIKVVSKGGIQKVKYLENDDVLLEGSADIIFEGKTYKLYK